MIGHDPNQLSGLPAGRVAAEWTADGRPGGDGREFFDETILPDWWEIDPAE